MSVPLLRFIVQESRPTREVHFALQTLADMMGYASTFEHHSNADATISYGPYAPGKLTNALHIHKKDSFWDGKAKPQFQTLGEMLVPALPNQVDPLYKNGVLQYDLPFVFYFFLSGEVELGETEKDIHGRPLPTKCYLGRTGIHQILLLNQYVRHLRDKLQSLSQSGREPIPLWPEGKRYAVALSHDVDACAVSLRHSLKTHRDLIRKRPYDLTRIVKRTLDLVIRPDFSDNFASIIEYERRLGVGSAFFFGSLFNDYNISNPKITATARYVRDQGWELGLHPSYNAYSDSERLRREKQSLEGCIGKNIDGIRHHYWRMDEHYAENTLLIHNRIGFQYDSSLAFNDDIGFRRGLALPYHPFHLEEGVLDLLEIPPTVMDGAVLYENVFQSVDDAMAKVLKHLRNVKLNEGLAVLGWHNYIWRDHWYPYWGVVYRRVLESLVEDSEAFVASPGKIVTYWLARERQLREAAV